MKLYIIPILLAGLLNLGAAGPDEIEHVLIKRAADAAFTVYYPFLERDTYPLPKVLNVPPTSDGRPNRGWFECKKEKCIIYVVVSLHPTEDEIVYTIAHELIHTFFTIQGMPVVKHHRIMYCEGYDKVLAKKVGYTEWNTFIPTSVTDLCKWMWK